MKRFKYFFRVTLLFLFILLTTGTVAQKRDSIINQMDSVEISLLTCQPHNEVYSLYGHTAIRFTDRRNNEDIVINYGLFSFGKPYFILRFVFGLTDYDMGIEPFEYFKREYASYGSAVTQQTLNLTNEEKQNIAAAIYENYKPENRTYRYNYFYDNCTTRARDIIINNIDGYVIYDNDAKPSTSYRDMIHCYNEQHRWARFGNDLLLGVKADAQIDFVQQQFLPESLAKDFDKAVIRGKNSFGECNAKRKLVYQSRIIVEPGLQPNDGGFPLSPIECSIVFATLVVLVTVTELFRKATYWQIDAILMLICGLAGLILFAMVFSTHPTVRLNFQILLLNPLALVFVYPTIKKLRVKRIHWWIYAWSVCMLLFFIGGLFQTYAEGMYFVAPSMLIRYILKIVQLAKTEHKEQKIKV